jgi:RNA polymerase sigma-70 factor (ECF subfamily)
MSLSQIESFRRGLGGEPRNARNETDPEVPGESIELATVLNRAIEAARGAFPSLAGDTGPFVTLLGRCVREALGIDGSAPVPSDTALAESLSRLACEDLYLACAAGHGDTNAIELLVETRVKPSVTAICRNGESAAFADEMIQVLRQKLLVAAEKEEPKILSFSGRAPLAAWIAVVVQRTVSTLRRTEGTREHFEKRAAIEAEIVERDPELGYIKAHYSDVFARAFERALAQLSDRERSLLRLHNLHGVTLQQLATVYGVNDATISRWLKQARAALVEETGRHMREAAGVSASEFASLARALTSQVDVSLNRWLASVVSSVSR